MTKTIISAGTLPFSKTIVHNFKHTLEMSGQIGLDKSGKLVDGIEEQTHQTMNNVKELLEENGWTLEDIYKIRIFLINIEDYAKVNEIYKTYFSKDYPTRVALAVKALPLGALIEMECAAGRDL